MKTQGKWSRPGWVGMAGLLVWTLGAQAEFLPEALVSTNSLPPAAGEYQLWPRDARVQFAFSIPFDGTNMPCRFDLEGISAGAFINIMRATNGADLVLSFDGAMDTKVPYMRVAGEEDFNLALYAETGHFRVRVQDGAQRTTGSFAVTFEEFSWMLVGYDEEGGKHDSIQVRLQSAPPSTGYLNVTRLSNGQYAIQSALTLYPEGAFLEAGSTEYFAPVTGPMRMVLSGTSRTLGIASTCLRTNAAGERFCVLYPSQLGTNYQYAVETTTDGKTWTETARPVNGVSTVWSDPFDSWAASLSASGPAAPWFRLKARPRQ